MARLPEEQWAMIEDSIDKKRTAASAFKRRTHCGKGGSVKFPSDFMSRKEWNNMNGEVVSYRMNSAMSWDEFKELPNDLKVSYIKSLREKFNVPDSAIAEMFDVPMSKLTLYLKDLKLEMVHDVEIWNKEAFLAWRSGGSCELVKENEAVVGNDTAKYEQRPMKWEELKRLSDPEKVAYIRWVRETFGAPVKDIAAMLGIGRTYLSQVCTKLGCNAGSASAGSVRNWDSTEFDAWVRGERVVEEIVEEPVEAAIEEILEIISEPAVEAEKTVEVAKADIKPVAEIVPESRPEPPMAIPTFGELNFDCPADRALNTLAMLLGNKHVQLNVRWDVVNIVED